MDTIGLRAASRKLKVLHERFAPCFGRRECKEHSLEYLRGLLLANGRKSIEPMALVFGEIGPHGPAATVLAWQRFITLSPWEAQDVQHEIQAVFNEEFVPAATQSPLGTVGVIDGSSFVKRGDESVGAKRQWCGRLGKKENCQVGVFLIGVTPVGSALLDHQLYLPEDWAEDAARRKKTRVPEDVTCVVCATSTYGASFVVDDPSFPGRSAGNQVLLLERRNRYAVADDGLVQWCSLACGGVL